MEGLPCDLHVQRNSTWQLAVGLARRSAQASNGETLSCSQLRISSCCDSTAALRASRTILVGRQPGCHRKCHRHLPCSPVNAGNALKYNKHGYVRGILDGTSARSLRVGSLSSSLACWSRSRRSRFSRRASSARAASHFAISSLCDVASDGRSASVIELQRALLA